ncbi:uncharacterized protein N7511_011089 [Penicillium nucicola]|uniref:uncharacterized protein n=1 Tax=Penicillium nucicola TaxID=1850975 RepID=UPI0025450A07|nr:uncharacterized protein N7511_011089 [Penicillium nucicola]KAJ5742688.1 hypothetical protein N7511_011089 [Penicillium nucicola]
MDGLEDDRELLHQLLNNLRDLSKGQVIQLLNVIRSNASLDEIKDYMDRGIPDELETSPELIDSTSHMADSSQSSRRTVMNARQLSDDPLWDVPAKPWTRLTDDDGFVSHLISLFFTWFHPYLNFMDRDRFIKDMQSGDPENSLYCSPFLVNAILADACAYSDYPEAFFRRDDMTSKGQHFYEEAKKLYGDEDGKASSCLYGRDRRGWLYVGQLVYEAQDLLDEHELSKESNYEPEVVNNVVWGLYNILAANSLIFHKRIMVRAPKIPCQLHSIPRLGHQDLWTPYPSLVGATPAHTQHMLKAYSDLSVTVFESSSWFFHDRNYLENMSFLELRDAADQLYARLKDWKTNINDCMKEQNNRTPHNLGLHMYWNKIVMKIYGFVQKKADQESPSPAEYQSVKERRLTAAREVGRLVAVHLSIWGNDRFPAANMQSCAIAEHTLLDDLDNPESRKAFTNLCLASKATARRWPLGRALLHELHVAAKKLKVTLPSETDALFSDIEDNWSIRSKRSNEPELDTFLKMAT